MAEVEARTHNLHILCSLHLRPFPPHPQSVGLYHSTLRCDRNVVFRVPELLRLDRLEVTGAVGSELDNIGLRTEKWRASLFPSFPLPSSSQAEKKGRKGNIVDHR